MLAAFPFALKHHLREERGAYADDLRDLVAHLDTWSSPRARVTAETQVALEQSGLQHSAFEVSGSDCTAHDILSYGCLPTEINFHLSGYFQYLKVERGLDLQTYGQALTQLNALMDVLSTCERIFRTRRCALQDAIEY